MPIIASAPKRKTQYEQGWDNAIKAVGQVLALAAEAYPRVPSEVNLQMFMKRETAIAVLEAVARYQQRVTDDINQRLEVEAAAK
jgi:hypothetical protein